MLATVLATILALALWVPRPMPRLAKWSTLYARVLVFTPVAINLSLLTVLALSGLTDGVDERGVLWARSGGLLLVGLSAEAARWLWRQR
jgi:hypothetical protein